MNNDLNVLGEPLQPCSMNPLTGFYRDGCCKTGEDDRGKHIVCAQMTEDFLNYTKSRGNDLSTAIPQFGFPGLKPGDQWYSHNKQRQCYPETPALLAMLVPFAKMFGWELLQWSPTDFETGPQYT